MANGSKVYIIAGEASGDLHAANMMEALIAKEPNVQFRFWGGDRMKSVSDHCVRHIRELAFMGFIEVVMNIRTIARNIRFCKRDILEYKPDVLVLVDYPGFNMRIAKWAKENGIKVAYYISPQVWAWKQKRVHTIKKVVDKMFVILPFEQEFYERFDYNVEYVGHPLLDEINRFEQEESSHFRKENNLDERPIIALLPGSRKQEISRKLPIMLGAVTGLNEYQIVIAGAPNLDATEYYNVPDHVCIVTNDTYRLLSNAKVASNVGAGPWTLAK